MKQVPITLINSQRQNAVSVADRGLAYGDGVFETMRVESGVIALWPYHYERLLRGLRCLQIEVKKVALQHHLEATADAIEGHSGVLKLMITRGEGGRGYQPTGDELPSLVSVFTPFTPSFLTDNVLVQDHGVHVHVCEHKLVENSQLSGIKSLNQLPYVLASKERQDLTVKEGLLFSMSDRLIEATARNIFIVKQGELYTPKLDQCGVEGVLRRCLMDTIAGQCGLVVNEVALTEKSLELADEVFLTNSVTHLWPVTHCGELRWGIGAMTKQLQQALDQWFKSETQHFRTVIKESLG